MNTETRMSSNLDQIRDQQRETWDQFWSRFDDMRVSVFMVVSSV